MLSQRSFSSISRRVALLLSGLLSAGFALAQPAAGAPDAGTSSAPEPAAAEQREAEAGAPGQAEPESASAAGGAPRVTPEHDPGPARMPDEERPLPDYGGAEDETSAGTQLLWVPRVLLFPAWLVSEYVVRRPLGWLATEAERKNLPTILVDFFTFDEEHKTGIVPTAFVEFNFRPSIGLYFFADDAFFADNEIRATASTGGKDAYLLSLAERVRFGPDREQAATVQGTYLRRPDLLFFGIGPRSPRRLESRYLREHSEASLTYRRRQNRSSGFESELGYRSVQFAEPSTDDTTLQQRIAAGALTAPPGLEGYSAAYQRLTYGYDTRPDRDTFRSQSGVRFGAFERASWSTSGVSEPHSAWLLYGADLGGYLDLGAARVLGLVLSGQLSDPLLGDNIPFFEQVNLGGDHRLPGFPTGRLVDRSGASAELLYTWPVWMYLDGELHFSVGNVFGRRFEQFDPGLLRYSTGIGIRTSVITDHPFQALLAFGSEPFDEGGSIEYVRFAAGTTLGY